MGALRSDAAKPRARPSAAPYCGRRCRVARAAPAADRARLAHELLLSLDDGTDADAEAAWAEEVRRRLEDVEAGRVALEGWDEVRSPGDSAEVTRSVA